MPTATKPAPPSSFEAKFNLARRADLDAQIAREISRFRALEALEALDLKRRIDAEASRFKELSAKFPASSAAKAPPTPKLHRMTDAGGKIWQHKDLNVLRSWMIERNKLLLAQAAAQKSGRGYGQIENKAVHPRY